MSCKDSPAFKEFASTTTIHGMTHLLISKSKAGTVVWVIIMIISLGGLGYMTYNAAGEFAAEPTTLEWSIKPLNQFPNITLYLQNIINESKAEAMGLSKLHMKYLLSHEPSWALSQEDAIELGGSDLTKLQQKVDEVCDHYNLSMYGLLESIRYDAQAIVSGDQAKVNYIGVPILAITAERQGYNATKFLSNSASFSFNVHHLTREKPVAFNEALRKTGYGIIVGDSLTDAAILAVAASTANSIVLSPERVDLLDRPSNPCRQSELGQDYCSINCYIKTAECQLGCKWWTPKLKESKFCSTIYMWNLTQTTAICGEGLKDCIRQCDIPSCRLWAYNEKINFLGPISGEECNNCTNMFVVYLREGWRTTVFVEKYVYSWTSLISNIGGLMGIFFGASIISIIHFCSHFFIKPCTK